MHPAGRPVRQHLSGHADTRRGKLQPWSEWENATECDDPTKFCTALNLNSKLPFSSSLLTRSCLTVCLSLYLSSHPTPTAVREGIDWLVGRSWSNAPTITSTIASACPQSLYALQQHAVTAIVPISCCIAIFFPLGEAKLGAHQLLADTSEEQLERCRQMRRGIEGGCGMDATMVGPAPTERRTCSGYATEELQGSDPQLRFRWRFWQGLLLLLTEQLTIGEEDHGTGCPTNKHDN